ncbi:hypothetical protein STCU_07337 [Strigomonas culicis]|uniref:Uncharacterized protein n=1 Tax=Strigomonas culicis TaxID=28005 RepID=S9VLG3_9TRYP|nr:hypothetical protein STCU_07337 [Strigomonas culicis]|eukprot:EPY24075.1 hypothetical protein STCU_07337 [Strigomonas culicis]
MLRASQLLLGGYMMYHRKAMGTMKYSRWQGAHGGISHFYDRTAMIEPVQNNVPLTMIDREMMDYVHRTRLRHAQLFRSYQQKSNATQVKLHEGEMLRRKWHRRLQKSFIAYLQYKTIMVLKEQAQLVTEYGQASVNAALGEPVHAQAPEEKQRVINRLHRHIHALPNVNPVPKHIATMKQIHNDRFNFRWRVN